MGISEAQKQNIDNVMNIISQICSTNDLNGCTIQYDLDSVVNTDGIFNVSLDLMNTVIFYLLFRERKSVIYSKIFKHTFDTFFQNKCEIIDRLFFTFRNVKVPPMNMNKFLLVIIQQHRHFFYYYVRDLFVKSIEFFIVYIDEKSPIVHTMINKHFTRTTKLLYQYCRLSEICLEIIENDTKFKKTCDEILDSFIKDRIRFNDNIPQHIYDIIEKQAHIPHKEKIKIHDEGLLIEQHITGCIRGLENRDVVKSNVYYLDMSGNLPSANKKGEFDLVIGAFDSDQHVFNIKGIYDIKRSARLIPDDIDKFNNSVDSEFILKDPIEQIKFYTQKLDGFKRGYIYVIDWDIPIESRYKLREILLKYILVHGHSNKFFQFMCDQIHGDHFKFNLNFQNRLKSLMNSDNEVLQSKLAQFDVHRWHDV